jgi:hypothetical protein
MQKAKRKTIDFSPSLHSKVIEHGEARGCRSFAESVRDIIRDYFSRATTPINKKRKVL